MKKFCVTILALIFAVSLLLSGCSNKSEYDANGYSADYENGEYETENHENEEPEDDDYEKEEDEGGDFEFEDFSDGDYEEVPQSIIEKTFTVSGDDSAAFKNSLASVKLSFDMFNDADIKKCLSAYNSLEKKTAPASNGLIKNRQVSFEDLYKLVAKNSASNTDSYYSKMPDDLLKKTLTHITEALNYQLGVNMHIDLNSLEYKLKDLRVLYFSDFGYAFYNSEERVLAVNQDIEFTDEEYRETIIHETNHLIQASIPPFDNSLENNMGVCYIFKDIELNYLYWNWYIEGVAQANTLTQLDMEAADGMVYPEYVNNLQFLNTALALTKENAYELYHTTTLNDPNALFDLFNCKNEQDKIEIIKLMSAFSILEEADNFSLAFYQKNPLNESPDFHKQLQVKIAVAVSKIFYRNLASKIENKSVKLGDTFALISDFESYLSSFCWYDSAEYAGVIKEFSENYGYIQDEFFKLVSASSGLSEEELYEYYTDFHHTVNHTEYENSVLSETHREFYKKIYNRAYFSLPLCANEVIRQSE